MDNYLCLIEWVIRVILILYAVITTIVLAVKRIKAKKMAGETVDTFDVVSNGLTECLGLILKNEKLFSSITKEGAKTGSLKSFMTLEEMKNVCKEFNIPYDASSLQSFINGAVALMNYSKTDTVHSNGQFTTDDKNNLVISEEQK